MLTTGPQGDETVLIGTRRRGSPFDLIVAEAMIVANSTWGQLLADSGVPGIYRSQASHGTRRESTHGHQGPAPRRHWCEVLRVEHLAAAPLHRFGQPVANHCLRAATGQPGALVAPFKQKDAALFAIISSFDAAYTSYNQFQAGMERYWTLRHLGQAGITEIDGSRHQGRRGTRRQPAAGDST
jgi:exoribonuclease-2